MDTLREQLADVQHAIWAHWMRYQFSACQRNEDGSFTIPADKVKRWERQIGAYYGELTEQERESDRHQADKVLKVIQPVLDLVPRYAHYFYTEALRLRLNGDMLGTPMSFAEWLAEAEEPEPRPENPWMFGEIG